MPQERDRGGEGSTRGLVHAQTLPHTRKSEKAPGPRCVRRASSLLARLSPHRGWMACALLSRLSPDVSSVPRIHCPSPSLVPTVCSRRTPEHRHTHTYKHTRVPPSKHKGVAVRLARFRGGHPSSCSLGQVTRVGAHRLEPQQASQRPAVLCLLRALPVPWFGVPKRGRLALALKA